MIQFRLERAFLVALSVGIVASCSFYTMPTLDLVVRLSATEPVASAVRESVEQFVTSKGLRQFDLENAAPNEPADVETQRARTTHWRNPESTSVGLGVMYFDLQPQCKVVRVLEQGKEWTQQSRAAIEELERLLSAIDGARVARGNSLEDWYATLQSPESYCK